MGNVKRQPMLSDVSLPLSHSFLCVEGIGGLAGIAATFGIHVVPTFAVWGVRV